MPDARDIARRRHAAAVEAVTAITDDLLGRAQREAPVHEGTLRGSGTSHVDVSATRVSGEVAFDTPYAARQHEEIGWMHPSGGKAKYLEDPLKEMAPRYLSALANAIRKVF